MSITLTQVEREFTASHLDPFSRDNPHEHRWRILLSWDTTEAHRDVRPLATGMDELLKQFAGKVLDEFLSPATAENIGAQIARLLGACHYRCWRPEGQCGGGEGAEGWL